MPENLKGHPIDRANDRPQFFDHPAMDRMMGIIMALSEEVIVLSDRMDRMQQIISEQSNLTNDDFNHIHDEADLQQKHDAFIQRIFRVLEEDINQHITNEDSK